MEINLYDHRSGLKVVPTSIIADISHVFQEYDARITANSVSKLKSDITNSLEIKGWSREYRLDTSSKITISSYLHDIGLCFQTGNVGRIYADLLKLQVLFTKGNIQAGIILVPAASIAKKLGSNMVSYERLLRELPIFNQVITMPIVVIGFDESEVR
jgi:hypothetical protein